MRRVELSGPDSTEGAACEVRYWRNAKAPGSGQSLWRANQDTDFCAIKARELIARLEAGGWTCNASQQPTAAAPVQAAGAAPELAPRAAPRPAMAAQVPAALRPESAEVAQSSRPGTAATRPTEAPSPAVAPSAPPPLPAEPPRSVAARAEPSAPVAEPPPSVAARIEPSAPPPSVVPRAEPSASPAEPPVPVVARAEPSPSDLPAAPAPATANAALLDQVVEQTLHSVEELYGGQFEAELAAFGDLDGDGLEDAAVLITYRADRNEYVQYLVAYLFNGETFQSVATRNVGGRFLDALRADLRGIAEGRILVDLEALDGGATCCARRRTAFALENGQLVEVADPGAASLEPPSPAEKSAPG